MFNNDVICPNFELGEMNGCFDSKEVELAILTKDAKSATTCGAIV